jgi:hypothetical protein
VFSATSFLNRFGGALLFRRRRERSQATPVSTTAPAATPVGHSVERRRSPRRYGNPVQILLSDGRLADDSPRAWVMDRSKGGLGIASPHPYYQGTNLGVRVANAPPGTPIVYVQVKSCHERAGRWFLNCAFIAVPPQEVLLLFR